MRQDTGRGCTIGEELAAILFSSDPQTDRVLLKGNGTVAQDTIKTQARDMQHILGAQGNHLTLRGSVGVCQLAVLVPIHFHAIRQKRVQA